MNWTKQDLAELTAMAAKQSFYCLNCQVATVKSVEDEYCPGCENDIAREVCDALAEMYDEQLLVERGLY